MEERVASTEHLKDGEMMTVLVGGKKVLLARVDGAFYGPRPAVPTGAARCPKARSTARASSAPGTRPPTTCARATSSSRRPWTASPPSACAWRVTTCSWIVPRSRAAAARCRCTPATSRRTRAWSLLHVAARLELSAALCAFEVVGNHDSLQRCLHDRKLPDGALVLPHVSNWHLGADRFRHFGLVIAAGDDAEDDKDADAALGTLLCRSHSRSFAIRLP